MASRTITRIVYGIVSVVLCIAAFLWGNYLLGLDCAILYLIITFGLLRWFVRALTTPGGPSIFGLVIVTILSIGLGYVMLFPASINPDIQIFIDKQAVDRSVRRELTQLFASDSAYRNLSVSSTHLKVVNITIEGSLATQSDLDRLRGRILAECPILAKGECILHWNSTFRDSHQALLGLDSELFRDVGVGK